MPTADRRRPRFDLALLFAEPADAPADAPEPRATVIPLRPAARPQPEPDLDSGPGRAMPWAA